MRVISPLRRGGPYTNRMKSLFGSSIVAYWPMWESAGPTSEDISGHAYHSTYTGVTLGETGIGDAHTAALFDGVNDLVTIDSAGFCAAYNGAEGSVLLWFRMTAATWADEIDHRFVSLRVDSNNYIYIQKAGLSRLWIARIAQGGNWKGNWNSDYAGNESWIPLAMTWSEAASQLKLYLGGVLKPGTIALDGTWTGSLNVNNCHLGCETHANWWPGWLAHLIVLNRPATAAEIAIAARA